MAISAVEIFEQQREFLMGLAYRMTGSVSEAEDVVQETYLRWHKAEREAIETPRAWLAKVCARLALDHLKSARKRREQYVGAWLPEPYVVSRQTPADQMLLDESISIALLAALERLSPAERATFLLHDVFHFSFNEVAHILDRSSAACRKLASRAREHVQADRPKSPPDIDGHRQLMQAFLEATRSGEMERLQALLHDDATLHSDGGGKAAAARTVVVGAEAVSKFLVRVAAAGFRLGSDMQIQSCWFNGAPGWVIYEDGRPTTAMTLAIDGLKVRAVYSIRNPDKLAGFACN